ncbi:MAG: hypothetical protein HQL55_15120 [Magnetococcales bacterium]|nr:hypothetical protein [Magnetococcales bacterium]
MREKNVDANSIPWKKLQTIAMVSIAGSLILGAAILVFPMSHTGLPMSMEEKMTAMVIVLFLMQLARKVGSKWGAKPLEGETAWKGVSDLEMAHPRQVRMFFMPLMMVEFAQLAGMAFAVVVNEPMFGAVSALLAIFYFVILWPHPGRKVDA